MAKKLVKYEVEKEKYIFIEVEEIETGRGQVPVSRELPEGTVRKFDEALDEVIPIADKIFKRFDKALCNKPNNVVVEFGIKMNSQVGAIVAAAGMEANFKISLSWNKE